MADLTVRKLDGALGAEIAGLDLAQPVDAADFTAIEDALDEHLVVLFRGQDLDAARPHALKSYRHPDHDDVSYIRNVDDDGKIDPFGNIRATTWHADATYKDVLPRLAILHAREIPSTAGGTFFANMCAAHDALPDTRKRELESLTGLHGYATGPAGRYYQGQNDHSGEFPERRRTGWPVLNVNPMHVHGFEGLAEPDALALVEEMAAHATQDRFVYHHEWQVGDVLIWDEQATMHRGAGDAPENERRVLLRTIVYPV